MPFLAWLYGKVAAFVLPGALIGAAALAALLGVQTFRLDHAKTALAEERADRATEKAIAEETARKAEARIASKERDHAVQQQALVDAQIVERAELQAALDAARADGSGLRADIDRFTAARASGTAVDAATAHRLADRALTLGQLFGEADRLAESLAGAAEQRNSEVRTLKRQLAADRLACGVAQ